MGSFTVSSASLQSSLLCRYRNDCSAKIETLLMLLIVMILRNFMKVVGKITWRTHKPPAASRKKHTATVSLVKYRKELFSIHVHAHHVRNRWNIRWMASLYNNRGAFWLDGAVKAARTLKAWTVDLYLPSITTRILRHNNSHWQSAVSLASVSM